MPENMSCFLPGRRPSHLLFNARQSRHATLRVFTPSMFESESSSSTCKIPEPSITNMVKWKQICAGEAVEGQVNLKL